MYKWRVLVDAPFEVSDKCCDIMKKHPSKMYAKMTGRKPILGTMANESKSRYSAWLQYGCNAFDKKNGATSAPLSFWTENDILEYIQKYNVPYASVYGDIVKTGFMIETINGYVPELKTTGCHRTGCMFCMFGCHLEKDGVGRFETMKHTHPKQYDYCMRPISQNGLGMKDVIDWINSNTGTNIKY